MALPTTAPIGNNANPVDLRAHYLNIITDLGGSSTATDLHALLKGLDVALYNSQLTKTFQLGPTGNLGATLPDIVQVNSVTQANQDGHLNLAAIWLPINTTVSNLNLFVGTTGDASPTNQWMGLFNSARVALAVSADALTAAITASTTTAPVFATYAVANVAGGAGTSFITTYTGLYYIGFAVNGSATLLTSGYTSILSAVNTVPKRTGSSTTAVTVPTTNFTTAQTAITGVAAVPYMFVS